MCGAALANAKPHHTRVARRDNGAPANNFDPADVVYNLDRIVDPSGMSTGGSTSPMEDPVYGAIMRDGSMDPNLTGPLGLSLIRRLSDPTLGIVLDSWLDADGASGGDASTYVGSNP